MTAHEAWSPDTAASRALALSISQDGILDQTVAVQLDVVGAAGGRHGLPHNTLCLADGLHGSHTTAFTSTAGICQAHNKIWKACALQASAVQSCNGLQGSHMPSCMHRRL